MINNRMGVFDAIPKITNEVFGVWSTAVKIPNIGGGDLYANTLEQLVVNLKITKTNIEQAWRLAKCLMSVFTNPAILINAGKLLLENVAGAVASMANRIMDAVMFQVKMALGQIFGTIRGTIRALFNFIQSIIQLGENIYALIKNVINFLTDWKDLEASEEDCAQMFSFIASCLLNKYLGNKMSDWTNKAVSMVNEAGYDINDKIYEELYDVNSYKNYINQQTNAINKANIQINRINHIL